MSVTFYPEMQDGDTQGYELRCDKDGLVETLSADTPYRTVRDRSELHGLSCDYCEGYGAQIVEVTDVPSVNVANSNAAYLLDLLGLKVDDCDSCPDYYGSCSAEDFLGRVLVAQGLGGHDEGRPAYELVPGEGFRPQWTGNARFIDCGRKEGYGDERLAQLTKVAEWARDAGRSVCWA